MANNDVVGNNVLLTGGLADGVQIGTKMPATGIFSSLISTGRTWLTQYTVLGGELNVTMGEGILPTAMGIADATYDFGRPLTVGDYLIIRSIYQTPYEYVQIGALVSGTIYNITRGLGTGGTALAWPANSVYILLGASGDGRIILTANGAPRLMVIEQGADADDAEPRVIVGLLDGITDPAFGPLTGWGFWGDKVYVTGALNATSGVISGELAIGAAGLITVGTNKTVIDVTGIKFVTAGAYDGMTALKWYNASAEKILDVYALDKVGGISSYVTSGLRPSGYGELHLTGAAVTGAQGWAILEADSGSDWLAANCVFEDDDVANQYFEVLTNTKSLLKIMGAGDITTTGDLTMAAGKKLSIDHIAEVTGAHGVVFDNNAEFTTHHTTTELVDHIGEHTGAHSVIFDNNITITGAIRDSGGYAFMREKSIVALANDGVAQLGDVATINGMVFVINAAQGYSAYFVCRGGLNTALEALDPSGVFSVTAGTAGTNVYWSAANSRYEIENKTGAARAYSIFMFKTD